MSKIDEFLNGIIVTDTETTGLDFEQSEIIEVAGGSYIDGKWVVKTVLMSSYKPIPPEASAIHHISNKMVKGFPKFGEIFDHVSHVLDLKQTSYLVAHNSDFDRQMLNTKYVELGLRDFESFNNQRDWICTWRLAKAVLGVEFVRQDGKVMQYGLSFLRYFLELDIDDNLPAHRAEADVTTCGTLLMKLIEIGCDNGIIDSTIDIGPQLVELCWKPARVKTWPIGKHRGKSMDDIPTDYFEWSLINIDKLNPDHANYDLDLSYTVEKIFEERGLL